VFCRFDQGVQFGGRLGGDSPLDLRQPSGDVPRCQFPKLVSLRPGQRRQSLFAPRCQSGDISQIENQFAMNTLCDLRLSAFLGRKRTIGEHLIVKPLQSVRIRSAARVNVIKPDFVSVTDALWFRTALKNTSWAKSSRKPVTRFSTSFRSS
jgi:hypothetical protein